MDAKGILSEVVSGKVQSPHLVLIYGQPSVGKSSFAANAPKPIFLDVEGGTRNLNVTRAPEKYTTSWAGALAFLNALLLEPHDYKTLAIDSLDWLEPMVWQHVCKENDWVSIESPGYGKGYVAALAEWNRLKATLINLRQKRGMNIVLIAHAHVKTINDPTLDAAYDRFQMKLNDKATALFREFVECLLFARFETFVKQSKSGKGKAFGDGTRVMLTENRPAFDAKNRFNLPFEMTLDWSEFEKACQSGPSAKSLISSIESLIKDMKDAKLKELGKTRLSEVGEDITKLTQLKNRMLTALGQGE